ncbi:MAG: GGDEF domain-containing protein [Filomicrobium sp.]
MQTLVSASIDRFFGPKASDLLLHAKAHPPEAETERNRQIIRRVQSIAGVFYILTIVWILVESLTIDWPISGVIIPFRLLAAVGFAYLARKKFEATLKNAYIAIGGLIGTAIAFCLAANLSFWWFGLPQSHFTADTYLYAPFLIAAGLSFFPLTALECLILALPLMGTMTLTAILWSSIDPSISVGAIVVILALLIGIGAVSAMSQLRLLLRLVERSSRDALTATLNRRAGSELLIATFALAERQNRPLSVIFIDLDRFKQINDRWGHASGDQVLQDAAQSIARCLRKQDSVIRWGGEEFAILLPETDSTGAERVVQKIAAHGIGLRPNHMPQTGSIGIAERTADKSTHVMELVELADQRMYRAKQAGRNCYIGPDSKTKVFIRKKPSVRSSDSTCVCAVPAA